MQSSAATVQEYLAELPEDRRATLQTVREVILKNLPEGFAESMQYGMIGYNVPLSLYGAGYHCKKGEPLPFAGLASQKNHCSVYFMHTYADPVIEQQLRDGFAAAGKKLNMGKSCIRFKKADDLALDTIAEIVGALSVEEYIALYEKAIKKLT